jgi:membrane protease YdiL (CAAX protease family)
VLAALEVLICSGFPTQLALGTTVSALGFAPYGPAGQLQIGYVVAISLADAIVLLGLSAVFLRAHDERPRDVLIGERSIAGEATYGVALAFAVLAVAIAVLLTMRLLVPSLHDVERNPMEALLGSPRDAWLFAFVAVVAGGVREEVQRAFLVHRFEEWLGGRVVGVAVTSTFFGVGHLVQGYDAAVVTGLLGAFWAVVFVRRRSVVAPIVSHAGFDLLQIAQFVLLGAG